MSPELHDGRSEDIFFDSFDFLESSNEFWAAELSAVHERCKKFLHETGFDKLFSTETVCRPAEIPVSIPTETEAAETTMIDELSSNRRTCMPGNRASAGDLLRTALVKKVNIHDRTEISEIAAHRGAIRTMKLSPCGKYLATGGEDSVVRLWKLLDDLNVEGVPLHEYFGHAGDISDLAWSRSNYLLSTSKDKTVRLWKVGCESCVKVFYHNDHATCIQFNPLDDGYFITGSVDRKVRIWSVDQNIVVDWVDTRNIVTAVSYKTDGKGFAVGTLSGNCLFYACSGASGTGTFNLQLDRQLSVWSKSKSPGKQITALQFCPGDSDRVMITSLDSKVRIFDGSKMVQKFGGSWKSKGLVAAAFTADGRRIVSVGENSNVCVRDVVLYCSSRAGIRSEKATKHFFSEGVTVAVPWVSASANSIPLAYKRRKQSLFSLGSCLCAASASATWPEEKLAATTPDQCLAVATGSCDGMIRLFRCRR